MVTRWLHGWNSRRGRPICMRWHIVGVERSIPAEKTHSVSSDWGEHMCCGPLKAQSQRGVASGPAYGLDSPDGLKAMPSHQYCPPAPQGNKQMRSSCWLHFLLYTCKSQAAQKKKTSSSLHFSQSLNCSRHSCMFHTHSVITFVLLKGKVKAWSNT